MKKLRRGTVSLLQKVWDKREEYIRAANNIRQEAHKMYAKFKQSAGFGDVEGPGEYYEMEGIPGFIRLHGSDSFKPNTFILQAEATQLYRKAETLMLQGNVLFLKSVQAHYGNEVQIIWRRKKHQYKCCIIVGIEFYGYEI